MSSCLIAVEDDVHKLWKLEIDWVGDLGWPREDMSVIDLWDCQCCKGGNHYQLPIPWKDREEPIPNNYIIANSRLQFTVQKRRKKRVYIYLIDMIWKLKNC